MGGGERGEGRGREAEERGGWVGDRQTDRARNHVTGAAITIFTSFSVY